MEEWVKYVLQFIGLGVICISDEVIKVYNELKQYITWQETTLEIFVYPILGMITIFLINKLIKRVKKLIGIEKKQTVEELREIIDDANEELKKYEND